jgi:hypothetical protein
VSVEIEERISIKEEISRIMQEKNAEIKRLQIELSRFARVE